jgi:IS5 family transposase
MTPKPGRKNASVDAMKLARKRFRRRAGIEPVIGHLKSKQRLKRNFLKGFSGDQINLIMAAVAFNFKKWMRAIIFWLYKLKPTNTGLKIIFLRPDTMVI